MAIRITKRSESIIVNVYGRVPKKCIQEGVSDISATPLELVCR